MESIRSVDIHRNIHKYHIDLIVNIVAGQMTHIHIMNIIKDSYTVYSDCTQSKQGLV